jgi:hypothetical protein
VVAHAYCLLVLMVTKQINHYQLMLEQIKKLARITWLSSTSQAVSPSSVAPPAFISVVSNKDQTGGSPSDFGMYLVASANPNNNNRTLWAGQHKANTIISAGSRGGTTSGDIYFAPARESATGNAVLLAERITDSTLASPHWAKIGYDNPTSNTGAKVSVTNGFNTAAGRNGNISLVLDRNDNGAGFGSKEWALKLQPGSNDLVLTEDDVVRTTFSGANITTSGNITAGNVITTNIHTNGTSLVLNANSNVVIRETIKGVSTNVGNISGDGYGFFTGSGLAGGVFFVQNVNAGNLDSYYFTTGNTTANSNIVTGVSLALISSGAANVSAKPKSCYTLLCNWPIW